jgi:TolB-like protein
LKSLGIRKILALIHNPERQEVGVTRHPSRFVLEGTVQRDGVGVEVTVQLIDSYSGRYGATYAGRIPRPHSSSRFRKK